MSLVRLPLPAKLAIWVILMLSLSRLLLQQRGAQSTILKLQADGRLAMIDAEGVVTECRVGPDTAVMPWLVVLRYQMEGKSASLVLPVDALGGEGHRQLRTWLRWCASVDPE